MRSNFSTLHAVFTFLQLCIGACSSGGVLIFGTNSNGQLAVPSVTDAALVPVPVAFPEAVTQIVLSLNYTLALAVTGRVYICGQGLGLPQPLRTPLLVSGTSGIRMLGIAAGPQHALMFSDTGVAYAVGSNAFGRAGLGPYPTVLGASVPTAVSALQSESVVAVAAGELLSLFLTAGGQVWSTGYQRCTGRNLSAAAGTDAPAVVSWFVDQNISIAQIACGQSHAVCLSAGGALFGFGLADAGRLGLGPSAAGYQLVPTRILGPWMESDDTVASVAVGLAHTIVVTSNMFAYGFGDNTFGQLGAVTPEPIAYNATAIDALPCLPFAGAAAGWTHSLFVTPFGDVYAAGSNNAGQTGRNTTLGTTSPLSPVPTSADVGAVVAGAGVSVLMPASRDRFSYAVRARVGLQHDIVDGTLLVSAAETALASRLAAALNVSAARIVGSAIDVATIDSVRMQADWRFALADNGSAEYAQVLLSRLIYKLSFGRLGPADCGGGCCSPCDNSLCRHNISIVQLTVSGSRAAPPAGTSSAPLLPSAAGEGGEVLTTAAIAVIAVIAGLVLAAIVVLLYALRRIARRSSSAGAVAVPLGAIGRDMSEFGTLLRDLAVQERLGGGHFSDVYRGVWQGTTLVALKRLKDNNSSQQWEEFKAEAMILKQLTHPNVVQYFGYAAVDGSNYMVTEFLSRGSLDSMVRRERSRLTSSDLLSLGMHAAAGMQYLETQRIVHRDLALRNLLVTQGAEGKYIVKIADFGLSRKLVSDVWNDSSTEIPVKWCSPEILEHGIYSHKSDVWAYGVVLWELFSYGLQPYPNMSNAETLNVVIKGFRLDAPAETPQDVYETMFVCWHFRPQDRPSFRELYKSIVGMLSARFAPPAVPTSRDSAPLPVRLDAISSPIVDFSIYGDFGPKGSTGTRYTLFNGE